MSGKSMWQAHFAVTSKSFHILLYLFCNSIKQITRILHVYHSGHTCRLHFFCSHFQVVGRSIHFMFRISTCFPNPLPVACRVKAPQIGPIIPATTNTRANTTQMHDWLWAWLYHLLLVHIWYAWLYCCPHYLLVVCILHLLLYVWLHYCTSTTCRCSAGSPLLSNAWLYVEL